MQVITLVLLRIFFILPIKLLYGFLEIFRLILRCKLRVAEELAAALFRFGGALRCKGVL